MDRIEQLEQLLDEYNALWEVALQKSADWAAEAARLDAVLDTYEMELDVLQQAREANRDE